MEIHDRELEEVVSHDGVFYRRHSYNGHVYEWTYEDENKTVPTKLRFELEDIYQKEHGQS